MAFSGDAKHLTTWERALLSGAVAVAFALAVPSPALADESLQSLQEKAISAGDAYSQAQAAADDLQSRIDDNQAKIDQIEEQLPEQRQRAAASAKTLYKMQQGQTSLVDLILSSDDFNDLISTMTYLDSINSLNSSALARLADMESDLKSTRDELATEKGQTDETLAAAQSAYATAQSAATAAESKAVAQQAAAQAAYEAQQAAAQQAAATTQAAATDDAPAAPSDTTSGSTSGSDSGSSAATGDWNWVEASEYGEGDGLMYSATASGETVTPTSMCVAMKYLPLGTIIQITYNGATCTARVNDRGPYAGNRQIDLQPAVASALGFDGIGTVGYRIVG